MCSQTGQDVTNSNVETPRIDNTNAQFEDAETDVLDEMLSYEVSNNEVHESVLNSSPQNETQLSEETEGNNNDISFSNLNIPKLDVTNRLKMPMFFNDTDDISATEYREILVHRITAKDNEDRVHKDIPNTEETTPLAEPAFNEAIDVQTTSSEESEESDNELPEPFGGGLRIIHDPPVHVRRLRRFDVGSITNVLRLFFVEMCNVFVAIRSSRSRSILTALWFMYGAVIVGFSRAFLPWMAFYTVLYFIIIYAEYSPHDALAGL